MIIHPSPPIDEGILGIYLLEDRAADRGTDRIPIYPYDPAAMNMAQLMVKWYAGMASDLRLPSVPDQLPYLGVAGAWIHRVTCRHKGAWGAFRRFVARRDAGIPYPTPRTEGAYTLASVIERLPLRWFAPLPGISRVDVHPPLVGSAMSADLGLAAVTGRYVHVEVVGMLASATSADRDEHCAAYRARLLAKLETYSALGLEPPVLIFVADLTPSGLTAKCNEVLARLGLPAQAPPSASSGWSGLQLGGGQTP